MKITTITIRRGTGAISTQTLVASGILAQIDQKSIDMSQFDHGAAPFDLFAVQAWTDLAKRNDHCVDENSTSDIYTISSRVETFIDGRSEFETQMPVGS